MKKISGFIITISLLCLVLCACSANNEYKGMNAGICRLGDETNYLSESFQPETEIRGFEIDDNLAIDIGNDVLKSVYGKSVIDHSEYSLRYIEDIGVYKFSRIPEESKYIDYRGEDWAVIIRKADGAILKIWIEG